MMVKSRPYDAEVEYLESTGTQWIDIDFSFKDSDGEVLELWLAAMSTYKATPNTITRGVVCNNLSTEPQITGSAISVQFYWAQTWRVGVNGWGNIHGSSSIAQNRTFYGRLDRISKTFYREQSGTSLLETDNRFGGPFTGIPYVLFANTATGVLPYPARLWYVKFAVDGIVKRDLIPVRKGQIGCMYDKVSGRAFYNANKSASAEPFIIGTDKVSSAGGG